VVEKNFTLCNPAPPQHCIAIFKTEHLATNHLTVKFKSDSSRGISSADYIVKRRWRFGDGSVLEGNEINPSHTFPGKGSYEVCLTSQPLKSRFSI
jgi:hypothetical protein